METPNFLTSVLNIIGSIASLAAIPLSVFLYLRSQEAKAGSLRRDIVRILSHQIGEGRLLSVFEIQAVIQSKAREHGLKGVVIPRDIVIEDLVTDTITNPMLESDRKQQIVDNMRCLHRSSDIYRIIDKYPINSSQLLEAIDTVADLQPEDKQLINSHKEDVAILSNVNRSKYFETLSGLFAIIAAAISLLSYFFAETSLKGAIDSIVSNYKPIVEVLLGMFSSILAVFIIVVVKKSGEFLQRRKGQYSAKEEDRKHVNKKDTPDQ